MSDSNPVFSVAAIRGATVNLFSVVCMLWLVGRLRFQQSSEEIDPLVAVVIVAFFFLEPLLVYLKMDAILGRVNPTRGRMRSFLFNAFTLPLLWGGRLALNFSLFIAAMRVFTRETTLPSWGIIPLLVFGLLREGFIVWCFTRSRPRFAIPAAKEWVIDLGYMVVLALSETMALQLVNVASAMKGDGVDLLIGLAFQTLFFVMFFLPLRLAYTLEELYSVRSHRDVILVIGSLLICFLAIVFLVPVFR